MSVLTVSQVARHFKIPPRQISDLFYSRTLSDEVCPIVSGRRIIPAEYLPTIEEALRQRGLIPDLQGAAI